MQTITNEIVNLPIGTTLHKFEAAGLGKAPYRYTGCEEKVHPNGDGTVKPGGSCQYCSTGIRYCFWFISADGKRFYVGSDCVHKAGDQGLIRIVDAEVSRINREKRLTKKRAEEAADMELCLTADLSIFTAEPHPTPDRAAQGETRRQWAEWMKANGYYKTLARAIRTKSK